MRKEQVAHSHSRLIDESLEQLDSLRSQVRQFCAGEISVYKSMSVIVRTLLMGSSGHKGLVEYVLPHATFLPLRIRPIGRINAGIVAPGDIEVTNDFGGTLHYKAGGTMPYLGMENGGIVLSRTAVVGGAVVARTRVHSIFHVLGEPLPLAEWLRQPFLRSEWTINTFIRCIANKDGGAHVDSNEELVALTGFGNIQRHLMEKLSAHVEYELRNQLTTAFPSHVRVAV